MDNKILLEQIVSPLLAWYRQEGRPLPWRQGASPYHVWISEIMLQQTRIEAVIPYYDRFLSALPDVAALAACEDEALMKLWEGLGYYSRARNLKKAAQVIMEKYGGQMPRTALELKTLPGIGDYTAGAIASIAFGERAPAVDGNVLRVLFRILLDRRDMASPSAKKEASALLQPVYPEHPQDAGDFTQALMELGERVCVPGVPRCGGCPLQAVCRAEKTGEAGQLPVLSPKRPRRIENITVLLLWSGNTLAMCKRPSKGLLAGLWEFPNLPGHLSMEEVREKVEEMGLCPESISPVGDRVHVFTHVEWHMRAWRITCGHPSDKLCWFTRRMLLEEIPIPTAFQPFWRDNSIEET